VKQPLPPPIQVDPELCSQPSKDFYFPPLSAFRTSETDPVSNSDSVFYKKKKEFTFDVRWAELIFNMFLQRKLDNSHLGRFYQVDNEFYKNVMLNVHCYPKEFKENCETLREANVLVRKPFLDVKNCIEASDLKKPVIRYMLCKPDSIFS
jgi:hypothetical protein